MQIFAQSPLDVPAAARVLAIAFAADPHVASLLPKKGDPIERLDRKFVKALDDCDGKRIICDVALDGDTFLGVSIWHAPEAGPEPWWKEIGQVPQYLRVYGNRTIDAIRCDVELAKVRPQDPHWYLTFIGAHPDARGTGVGSALVNHRLAQADRDGVGAYLESSSRENAGYYERFGFVDHGEITSYGSPPTIAMWRDPEPVDGE